MEDDKQQQQQHYHRCQKDVAAVSVAVTPHWSRQKAAVSQATHGTITAKQTTRRPTYQQSGRRRRDTSTGLWWSFTPRFTTRSPSRVSTHSLTPPLPTNHSSLEPSRRAVIAAGERLCSLAAHPIARSLATECGNETIRDVDGGGTAAEKAHRKQ